MGKLSVPGGRVIRGRWKHSVLLNGKNDAEFGQRRSVEVGTMSRKSLDEQNGKQNARFIRIVIEIAIVFTSTRFALFSLCVVKVGTKLECSEGPVSRF